jgi:SAM-dependent methyltransferase
MTMFDQASWEERYSSSTAVWSGQPNSQLVAEAADLRPGRALDVGSGEGADALWLAARGWQVTGVDFSTVALERAAGHAAAAGLADRISWWQEDVRVWAPPAGAFDLVSSQFMHLPPDQRGPLFDRLAAAVAPGGILLVVGHDVSDLAAGAHRPHAPERFFSAAEVAAGLDPSSWEVLVAESRPRPAKPHEGTDITVADAVLVARRQV